MLIGQLNASQIPYDWSDWLQMGVYFVALPVVAWLGAALGLVGRWRNGGMLWSTNVGLLGGAVAGLIFILGIATLEGENATSYFSYFVSAYRWQMLMMTLAATLLCAIVAGIAWRTMHAPREKQSPTFSMRSFLLVQLFALISLGSFVGLRLFMLQNSKDTRLYEASWESPGWTLAQGGHEVTFDSTNLTPKELEEALSPRRITQIANYRNTYSLVLLYHPDWNADFSPLLQSANTGGISVYFYASSPKMIDQLAASNIKSQTLGFLSTDGDLSAYSKFSSLRNLRIDKNASNATIESLAECNSLESLFLFGRFTNAENEPVQKWPRNLQNLEVLQSTFSCRDLDSLAAHATLKQLLISEVILDEPAVKVICGIPNLNWVSFALDDISESKVESLINRKFAKIELHFQKAKPTLQDIALLAKIPNLQLLDLSMSQLNDESLKALSQIKSLEHLMIADPTITEEGLMQLAVLPKLQQLRYPPKVAMGDQPRAMDALRGQQIEFDAKRAALNFPRTILYPLWTLPPLAPARTPPPNNLPSTSGDSP